MQLAIESIYHILFIYPLFLFAIITYCKNINTLDKYTQADIYIYIIYIYMYVIIYACRTNACSQDLLD